MDLVKFRIVWWFKKFRKGIQNSFQSLLLNFKELFVDIKNRKHPRIEDWNSPSADSLKFNFNVSSNGKPRLAGIGGVLRDSKWKILCLSSFFLGIADSNLAELWAIHRTVQLCLLNKNLRGRDIYVVSESKIIISWVNGDDFGNVTQVECVFFWSHKGCL
ncbi:hypothetical protein Ddye_009904 [Dipteronia dyeriana]|uniref:RNase H type-1 domain-containing protein n=1 Tax=Dipteronia dyeriana TaxID=168575 RepID=A0AAD9XCP4_9ROSI|nr:hypothetical protein Ddye_009904 [Dipteronia dyeriana]